MKGSKDVLQRHLLLESFPAPFSLENKYAKLENVTFGTQSRFEMLGRVAALLNKCSSKQPQPLSH